MNITTEPLVSICCITYNHENCIRDAIEGFLMQKTDFPFEILIHDDASTDSTADIIKEYEEKYPDIIKPIYQTENQYSQGKRVSKFNWDRARGKYLASCEGDDFWIDPLKLQKQITEMEKNPDCYISFHPAIRRWVDGSREDRIFGKYSDKVTIFPMEKIILGGGGFIHTGSIVLNRLVIPRVIAFFDIAPEAPVGDYYVQMLGAEHGGALYLSDVMSVYRSAVPGSWSVRQRENYNNTRPRFIRSSITSIDKLDLFTNNKYSKLFDIKKRRYYSGTIISPRLDINTKKIIIEGNMNNIDIKDRMLWNLVFKHPLLAKISRSLYQFALRIHSRMHKNPH